MLEMIVAVFILQVAIVGCYVAFSQIISTTMIISSRLTAAYLAQEGIEIARNIRDTKWVKGESWDSIASYFDSKTCATGCEFDYTVATQGANPITSFKFYNSADYLKIDSNGFYSYQPGNDTKFTRKMTITHTSDTLTVLAEVMWADKGALHTFSAKEILYNWLSS